MSAPFRPWRNCWRAQASAPSRFPQLCLQNLCCPPCGFTIAFPFVDILLHLEVQVGASQVGPGSEEFEDILLLHLQDIETSGHCGVSLWKQRQGTCGHKHPCSATRGLASPSAPRGPGRLRRHLGCAGRRIPRPASGRPCPAPHRAGLALPRGSARSCRRHGKGAQRPAGSAVGRTPHHCPRAPARTHASNAVWRPRRERNEKEVRLPVRSIYRLPSQWEAAGRAGLRRLGRQKVPITIR